MYFFFLPDSVNSSKKKKKYRSKSVSIAKTFGSWVNEWVTDLPGRRKPRRSIVESKRTQLLFICKCQWWPIFNMVGVAGPHDTALDKWCLILRIVSVFEHFCDMLLNILRLDCFCFCLWDELLPSVHFFVYIWWRSRKLTCFSFVR